MDNKDFLIKEDTLTDIADSIRNVDSTLDKMTPTEMADEIQRLTAVIDQRYNAASTNPQAGIAVAEGIQQERLRAEASEDQNEQNIINETTERKQADSELQSQIDNIESTSAGKKTDNGGEIFNDYENNKALSNKSATFGSNNISGCLAFKMTDYSYDESSNTTTIILGECPEANLKNLAIGDTISCKIVYSYDFIAKIKSIDVASKTIVVDNYIANFPLDTTSKTPGKDNGLLWIPDKPDAGYIELELTAFTTGSGNINNGDGSIVSGINNKVSGDYSIVGGASNEATEGALVAGTGNKVKRENSAAVGGVNLVESGYSFASGYNNLVHTNTSRASGQGNWIGYEDLSKNTAQWYGSAADGVGNRVYVPHAYASGRSNQIFGEGSTAHGFNNYLYSQKGLGVGSWNYVGTLAFKVSKFSINEDKTELTLIFETIDSSFDKITTSMTGCIRFGEVEVLSVGSVISTDKSNKTVKTKISVNIPDDISLAKTDNYFWLNAQNIGDTYITANTFASGMYNRIAGNSSSANGYANRVDGSYSGAFGKNNRIGQLGFIEGLNNNAQASYNTHVEGSSNQASTNNVTVHVEGTNNQVANSENTHVEGSSNQASTNNVTVHVEGTNNQVANSENTHVEGSSNIVVRSKNSYVGGAGNRLEDGNGTILFGNNLGYGGNKVEDAQTQRLIIGRYNTNFATNQKDVFFLIGDGTGGAEKAHDAFIVYKDSAGNYTIRLGDVSVKASNLAHCNIPVQADTWNSGSIVQRTNTGAIKAKNTTDSDSNDTVATKGYLLDKTKANTTLINNEVKARENADNALAQQIANITAVQIRNKSEVIESTEANVQTTATNYIVTNYKRQPQNFDGLIITVTDKNSDKILYIYSEVSKLWINSGINDVDLSNYYTKSEINDKVDIINESITTETELRTKADTTLQENIDNEKDRAIKAEQANETLITTETNERKSAISALNKQIVSFDIYSSKTDFTTIDVLIPAKETV